MMLFYHNRNQKIKNNALIKNVTLQVRIPRHNNRCCGKRASSAFSSCSRASLTVEAALCLSLFVFFTVIMLVPMKIMNTQRQIQAVLESVGEEFSQYGYISWRLEQGKDDISDSAGWDRDILAAMAETACAAYTEARIRDSVPEGSFCALSIDGTQLLKDQEILTLRAVYQLKLPFPVLRVAKIPASSVCCRRIWIGREGGRTGADGEGSGDETVYISKNPTCYHRSRECRYLYKEIRAVRFEDLGEETNSAGRHYQPCAVCGAKAGKGETVYVLPGGEHYHSDRCCSSIVAYVRAVSLSEVEALGPCSSCGGKENTN